MAFELYLFHKEIFPEQSVPRIRLLAKDLRCLAMDEAFK
jgi:hypothetical protein